MGCTVRLACQTESDLPGLLLYAVNGFSSGSVAASVQQVWSCANPPDLQGLAFSSMWAVKPATENSSSRASWATSLSADRPEQCGRCCNCMRHCGWIVCTCTHTRTRTHTHTHSHSHSHTHTSTHTNTHTHTHTHPRERAARAQKRGVSTVHLVSGDW